VTESQTNGPNVEVEHRQSFYGRSSSIEEESSTIAEVPISKYFYFIIEYKIFITIFRLPILKLIREQF